MNSTNLCRYETENPHAQAKWPISQSGVSYRKPPRKRLKNSLTGGTVPSAGACRRRSLVIHGFALTFEQKDTYDGAMVKM